MPHPSKSWTHSVCKGDTLTATAVHLDAAVLTLDSDPAEEFDTLEYSRKDPVNLLEAATAPIAADHVWSYLPPIAELEIALRHQREPSPLPVSEDPANLPGIDVAPATDAHEWQRYALQFPRGGLPTFPLAKHIIRVSRNENLSLCYQTRTSLQCSEAASKLKLLLQSWT